MLSALTQVPPPSGGRAMSAPEANYLLTAFDHDVVSSVTRTRKDQ